MPNKTGHIEIIFKLANDCREVPFFNRLVGRFYHFGSDLFYASVILERNENLLARNETRLAGNETRLARNETRGGNLHLSGTVGTIGKFGLIMALTSIIVHTKSAPASILPVKDIKFL